MAEVDSEIRFADILRAMAEGPDEISDWRGKFRQIATIMDSHERLAVATRNYIRSIYETMCVFGFICLGLIGGYVYLITMTPECASP